MGEKEWGSKVILLVLSGSGQHSVGHNCPQWRPKYQTVVEVKMHVPRVKMYSLERDYNRLLADVVVGTVSSKMSRNTRCIQVDIDVE